MSENEDLVRAWEVVRRAQADLGAALDAMANELNRRDYIEDVMTELERQRGVPPHDCKPLPGRPLPGPENPVGVCPLCGFDGGETE